MTLGGGGNIAKRRSDARPVAPAARPLIALDDTEHPPSIEQELRRERERYRTLSEAAFEGIVVHERGCVLEVNRAFAEMWGYGRGELAGMNVLDLVEEGSREQVARHLRAPSDEVYEIEGVSKDGRVFPIEVAARYIPYEDRVVRVTAVRDLTQRKAAELALRRSERRFRSLVQHASDVIAVLDRDGAFRSASPAVRDITGYPEEALVGRRLTDLAHRDDAARVGSILERLAAAPHEIVRAGYRLVRADGAWRHVEAIAQNLLDDPAIEGIVVNLRDVTERITFEAHLAHQAVHDPLTGLPNRLLLLDRLGVALARSRRAPTVAVLLLDLDRFKVINDSLGHDTGDLLLVALARRLCAAVRPSDTVARFGGDEFVVLCEQVAGAPEAVAIAQRIEEALAAPFDLGENEAFLSASIGIALAGTARDRADSLLRDADAAMYKAKERGRGRHEIFDQALRERALARLVTENALHHAIGRGELRVHYQPVISLVEERIVGMEALVRWEHPERGLLAPAEFISVAEETGLIVPIGEWVLRQACMQARAWRDEYPEMGLRVAVNLSARQLAQPDLTDSVAVVLEGTGLPADALCLEITETTLLGDADLASASLSSLRSLGVRLAIDDFGTGYSSLSHIKRLPVDIVKVDRSFVAGLGRDEGDRTIVTAVVGIAHALGLEAVAEGVETGEQLEALTGLGCEGAQGYFFAEPHPAAGVRETFERYSRSGS